MIIAQSQNLLTDAEAAEVLRISVTRVRALARQRGISYVDLGDGDFRFDLTDLRDYVRKHRIPNSRTSNKK